MNVTAPTSVEQKTPATAPTDSASKAQVDYQSFLKLLVAQMKNQDPMNPMDGQEMAAQLAQFTSVEQLINANDTLAKIRELLSAPAPTAPTDESQPPAA